MQLVLLIGIQATGKSAFYRERFLDTHVRLNLDMLRTRHREELLFRACLAATQPLVIDNTNVTRADRARYIAPALAVGFEVVGYFFESSAADAIRRNAQRPPPRRVPVPAIHAARKRLEPPRIEEGFHHLYAVRLLEATAGFEVAEWRGPV